MAPARRPARGASKASAPAKAKESAPPLQATRTVVLVGRERNIDRTAERTAATAGGGPLTL